MSKPTRKRTQSKTGSKKKTKVSGDVYFKSSVKFASPPKKTEKDRKAAKFEFEFTTNSGTWSVTKSYSDVSKFVSSTIKNNDKLLSKQAKDLKKEESGYLKKDAEKYLKFVNTILTKIGKDEKASKEKGIISFLGAKDDNLKDIKSSNKIEEGKKTGKKEETEIKNDTEEKKEETNPETKVKTSLTKEEYEEEIENLKRKNLHDVQALQTELNTKEQTLRQLQDTIKANEAIQNDQLTEIEKLKSKLGPDGIGDETGEIFDDDINNADSSLADKYHRRAKELEKAVEKLTKEAQELREEKGELEIEVERTKHNATELGKKLKEYQETDIDQLRNLLAESEAELDEAHASKDKLKEEISVLTENLAKLNGYKTDADKKLEDRNELIKKHEQLQKEFNEYKEKSKEVQKARDDTKQKLEQEQKKLEETVTKDKYKKDTQKLEAQIEKLTKTIESNKKSREKEQTEMKELKTELGNLKIEIGTLTKENEILVKGGGRDVNLNIELNLESGFSVFKQTEFEFPENISRDELKKWTEHVKTLIKEINDEFCTEIEKLYRKTELYEDYLESKNIPLPEDGVDYSNNEVTALPHPLPSMHFEDLANFNPTKKQLKEYINLMFSEWRKDEDEFNETYNISKSDIDMLNKLNAINEVNPDEKENGLEEVKVEPEIDNEKYKEMEKKYLDKIKELEAEIEMYTKKKEKEEKHKALLGEADLTPEALKSQLDDALGHVGRLEDELKDKEFNWKLATEAMIREHEYDVEKLDILLKEAETKVKDLEKQIGSDDLNKTASEFREELWAQREANNEIKLNAIERCREADQARDNLAITLNRVRIKEDRALQVSEIKLVELERNLGKKEQQLQHFIEVAKNVSELKEIKDKLEADKDELESSYQRLVDSKERERNEFIEELEEEQSKNKKLEMRIRQAEEDLKRVLESVNAGKPVEGIITRTELDNLVEDLKENKTKYNDVCKQKISLLRTSSLEIDRLRDEIKLLSKQRQISKRDIEPNRFHSSTGMRRFRRRSLNGHSRELSNDTIGSTIPFLNAPHQQLLKNDKDDDVSTITAAWNYTVGFVSSVGTTISTAFTGKKKDDNIINQQQYLPNQSISNINYAVGHGHMPTVNMTNMDTSLMHRANPSVIHMDPQLTQFHGRTPSRDAYERRRIQPSLTNIPMITTDNIYQTNQMTGSLMGTPLVSSSMMNPNINAMTMPNHVNMGSVGGGTGNVVINKTMNDIFASFDRHEEKMKSRDFNQELNIMDMMKSKSKSFQDGTRGSDDELNTPNKKRSSKSKQYYNDDDDDNDYQKYSSNYGNYNKQYAHVDDDDDDDDEDALIDELDYTKSYVAKHYEQSHQNIDDDDYSSGGGGNPDINDNPYEREEQMFYPLENINTSD